MEKKYIKKILLLIFISGIFGCNQNTLQSKYKELEQIRGRQEIKKGDLEKQRIKFVNQIKEGKATIQSNLQNKNQAYSSVSSNSFIEKELKLIQRRLAYASKLKELEKKTYETIQVTDFTLEDIKDKIALGSILGEEELKKILADVDNIKNTNLPNTDNLALNLKEEDLQSLEEIWKEVILNDETGGEDKPKTSSKGKETPSRLDPNAARTYNNRGNVKYNLKDYYGAISDYTEAIRLNPNYADAYGNRGDAKYNLKDYSGACKDYSKAKELGYKGIDNSVITYACNKKPKTSSKGKETSSRLDPNAARTYNNRGRTKYRLKDYNGAISDYNEAIRLDPNFAFAYNNRGVAKDDLKDYNGAISDYNEAIRLDPNFASAYYNRGGAKYSLKDYNGAISDHNEAIRLNPNDASYYSNRGRVKGLLKDYNGAISDYTEAIRLDPNYAKAYNNRGRTKHILKDYKGACKDGRKAKELGYNSADYSVITYACNQ